MSDSDKNLQATEFIARITVLQHPSVIPPGYCPTIWFVERIGEGDYPKEVVVSTIPATIEELISIFDPKSMTEMKHKPDYIKTGDIALIRVKLFKSFAIKLTSLFVVRDQGWTIADGQVVKIIK